MPNVQLFLLRRAREAAQFEQFREADQRFRIGGHHACVAPFGGRMGRHGPSSLAVPLAVTILQPRALSLTPDSSTPPPRSGLVQLKEDANAATKKERTDNDNPYNCYSSRIEVSLMVEGIKCAYRKHGANNSRTNRTTPLPSRSTANSTSTPCGHRTVIAPHDLMGRAPTMRTGAKPPD